MAAFDTIFYIEIEDEVAKRVAAKLGKSVEEVDWVNRWQFKYLNECMKKDVHISWLHFGNFKARKGILYQLLPVLEKQFKKAEGKLNNAINNQLKESTLQHAQYNYDRYKLELQEAISKIRKIDRNIIIKDGRIDAKELKRLKRMEQDRIAKEGPDEEDVYYEEENNDNEEN